MKGSLNQSPESSRLLDRQSAQILDRSPWCGSVARKQFDVDWQKWLKGTEHQTKSQLFRCLESARWHLAKFSQDRSGKTIQGWAMYPQVVSMGPWHDHDIPWPFSAPQMTSSHGWIVSEPSTSEPFCEAPHWLQRVMQGVALCRSESVEGSCKSCMCACENCAELLKWSKMSKMP